MILNEAQMNVFKAVVYLDTSTIGKIAQTTGMHRRSVKIILTALIDKGFVYVEQEANKLLYSANDLDQIKDKHLSTLESLKKTIPPLRADYEETKDTQIINAVSGTLGLRTVLLDEIMKGKEISAFILSPPKKEFDKEYKANDKRRKQFKIPLRMITNYDYGKLPLTTIKKTSKKSTIDLFMYANKLTIVYNDVETNIFTIKIEEITKFFKSVFEKGWKS